MALKKQRKKERNKPTHKANLTQNRKPATFSGSPDLRHNMPRELPRLGRRLVTAGLSVFPSRVSVPGRGVRGTRVACCAGLSLNPTRGIKPRAMWNDIRTTAFGPSSGHHSVCLFSFSLAGELYCLFPGDDSKPFLFIWVYF